MSLNFYLDRNVVFALYRKQKKGKKIHLSYYPGINVEKGWSQKIQRSKDSKINEKLDELTEIIENIIESTDISSLTNDLFSKLIDKELNKRHKPKTDFITFCRNYYEEYKEEVGYERAKNIQTTINKLNAFSPGINTERIDSIFYKDFLKYLKKKDYSNNYIGRQIKNLKQLLKQAREEEYEINIEYKDFKATREKAFNIYLTIEEIESIYNLDFKITNLKEDFEKYTGKSPNFTDKKLRTLLTARLKSLDNARKLLVIGCWTGLRVGNYLNIDPDIQADLKENVLHVIANKNGPKLQIPLHRLVREILTSGDFPKQISDQKFNKQIKELGKLAGITKPTQYYITKGGKRRIYTVPKYKLIKSHTARRSFATNLFLDGVPLHFIKEVLGHASIKQTEEYIKATGIEITKQLMKYSIWDK